MGKNVHAYSILFTINMQNVYERDWINKNVVYCMQFAR